jgi:hypothetical protein
MTYEMANGGTEENKLLKELYLDRWLQSRRDAFIELADLLVDSYQAGLTDRNLRLATLSKSLMAEYGDPETVQSVTNRPVKRSAELAERYKVGSDTEPSR